MISTVLPTAALVGCGLTAGVFLAFSTSVMPGLRRMAPAAGAGAMQHCNRAILNPLFLTVFLGTALVSLVLVVAAPLSGGPGAGWFVVGGLLHLVGSIAVTMVVNVPLNNRLDAADPDSAEGQRTWARYLARWTAWNHVRAAAATAATAALAVGLCA